MAYSNKVIDHYENPRNVGTFNKDDSDVGTGMVGAPACGDVMRLQIKVNDQGIIEDAKFKTYGCGSAIASSSLITEWVKGKSLDDALAIKNSEIAEELELPPVKIHCSILAEDAVKAAGHVTRLFSFCSPPRRLGDRRRGAGANRRQFRRRVGRRPAKPALRRKRPRMCRMRRADSRSPPPRPARRAVCIACQEKADKQQRFQAAYNRRGSKDSQLK